MLQALDGAARGAPQPRYQHPGYPPIDFRFDGARLLSADYTVDAPEGGKMPQRIDFAEQVESGPVAWPRKLTITIGDAPYFALEIATFSIQPA